MITYMVQREIHGIGLSGRAGCELAAARSVEAVERMAPRIRWCHSWVGADHLLSLYRARSVADIIEHSRLASLPAGNVARVLRELPCDCDDWIKCVSSDI